MYFMSYSQQYHLNLPGNIFTDFMCRRRSRRVNNSGLYMFAIGLWKIISFITSEPEIHIAQVTLNVT